MGTRMTPKPGRAGVEDPPARRRILEAAFSTFMERGYAETSTLEIATRARVSKRELYALVGSKQGVLMAHRRARHTAAGACRIAPAARPRDPRACTLRIRRARASRGERSHSHCPIPPLDLG